MKVKGLALERVLLKWVWSGKDVGKELLWRRVGNSSGTKTRPWANHMSHRAKQLRRYKGCINLFLTRTLSSSSFKKSMSGYFRVRWITSFICYLPSDEKKILKKVNNLKKPPVPHFPFSLQVKCPVSYNPNRREIYSTCMWYSRAHLNPLCVWNPEICGNTYTNFGNRACPAPLSTT